MSEELSDYGLHNLDLEPKEVKTMWFWSVLKQYCAPKAKDLTQSRKNNRNI
jgi:hypothetical protein